MQIQADLISIPVYRPKMRETTALGAAIAAGLAIGLWRNFTELRDINRAGGTVFEPSIPSEKAARMFATWEKAVRMSRGWVDSDKGQANVAATNVSTTAGLSAASDLDDADEEDLLLELRKIEIQQKLKRLRKGKGTA